MAEIQPEDIDPRQKQCLDHFVRGTGRTESGYDFRAALTTHSHTLTNETGFL
jgi:hypothetical protein